MTRNLVDPETAERNRAHPFGAYTFHAPIPDAYEGVAFAVAVVRIGDHAHLDVLSGRKVAGQSRVNCGGAGKLILRWHEWEVLRALLDQHDCIHVAEVENPRPAQIDYHLGRSK